LLDLTDPERPKPGKPELFLAAKYPVQSPAFSSDGRWIAYTLQDQIPQVFVRPFPGDSTGSGGQSQISTEGGARATWSRNSNEIVYLPTSGNGPQTADYKAQSNSFVVGQPRPWAKKWPTLPNPPALMPDGKRFVAVISGSQGNPEPQTHVDFLLNFADELQRRIPAAK
jgi:hypothetical protein